VSVVETKAIFARARSATVGIVLFHPAERSRPYTIIGSGFCIDASGVIVTCQHVVSAFMSRPIPEQIASIPPEKRDSQVNRLDEVQIVAPYVVFLAPGHVPHEIQAFLSRVDQVIARTDYDLAIIRALPHAALAKGYPTLEIQPYAELSEGDEVATCGYPLGDFLFQQIGKITPSFTRGSISSIVPTADIPLEHLKLFQLNLTATYGNSGGPVFSIGNGKVFGVLQGGIKDRQGNILAGLSRAEPVYPVANANDIDLIKSFPRGELPKGLEARVLSQGKM
jgi:S1-C subfamily serine protease